jgi:hypothetical protein
VLKAEQAAQDAMPSSSDSDSDVSSSSNVNSSSGTASQSRQLLNSGSHIVSRVSNTCFHLLLKLLQVIWLELLIVILVLYSNYCKQQLFCRAF